MSTDRITLANLLTPMQFKTALLAACGLKNSEIAEFLDTRELVIKKTLTYVYSRTGCSDRSGLILRYVREVESGLLEIARLRREFGELQARTGQNPRIRPDLLQRINWLHRLTA